MFDSDTILLTNNKILIDAAKRNYDTYKVPTNFVEAQKTKRYYTVYHKADLDIKTSVNKIGEIVNLSQQLNSLYWERRANGESVEDCEELYNDTCKLAVLSGCDIDRAKKEFVINSGYEINTLKRKYHLEDDGKTLKPMFFKMITKENGYGLPPNTKYRYFKTPMDYLQKIVTSANYRQARSCKTETIPFMDIVRKPNTNSKSGYYGTRRDVAIAGIRGYKKQINECYLKYDDMDKKEKEAARIKAAEIKDECINYIDCLSNNEYLMFLVLKALEKKENADIRMLMFETLFGQPNEAFMCMINESVEPIEMLQEDKDGIEEYYGIKFSRVKNKPKMAA